jgi:AcrR family transcriptional regulator
VKLFYENGLRATGIDRIIAESGVAKMSFYRYFPSKSDLIAEFLHNLNDFRMDWFITGVEEKLLESKGGGLEVIADVLHDWFEEPDFRGCAFINTVAETPGFDAEPNSICRDHKVKMEAYIEKLAARLGIAAPKKAAATAMIIIDGTIVQAQVTGNPNVTRICKQLLKDIGRE